jgi:hypothetical protein
VTDAAGAAGLPLVPTAARVMITSRDFGEYLAMFGLEPERLRGARVLDCPGGASDFTAAVWEHGGRAVAADPAYRSPPAALARLVLADLADGARHVPAAAAGYDFSWTGGREAYLRRRAAAARRFLADYAGSPGRYVAACLPSLPFRGQVFSLALVPNLLFTYAHLYGPAWHRAAIAELARVACEVRIHPVTDAGGRVYRELAPLRRELAAGGIATRLVEAGYRLHPGRQWTLVCRPATAGR